jgi:hypothetical protein
MRDDQTDLEMRKMKGEQVKEDEKKTMGLKEERTKKRKL